MSQSATDLHGTDKTNATNKRNRTVAGPASKPGLFLRSPIRPLRPMSPIAHPRDRLQTACPRTDAIASAPKIEHAHPPAPMKPA